MNIDLPTFYSVVMKEKLKGNFRKHLIPYTTDICKTIFCQIRIEVQFILASIVFAFILI